MGTGYFLGLGLAVIGIFFGFQACFFFHLWMSGEITNIRFGFLVFTLLGALVFVMKHLNSSLSLLVAILPIIFWAIFWLKDKVVEKRIDKRFYEKELEKWKRTIEFDPKNVGAYIALGDIHKKKEKFDKAISYYRDALNLYKGFDVPIKSPSLESKLKLAQAEKEAKEGKTTFCSECGATNLREEKFCRKCGTSLSAFAGLEKREILESLRFGLYWMGGITLFLILLGLLPPAKRFVIVIFLGIGGIGL